MIMIIAHAGESHATQSEAKVHEQATQPASSGLIDPIFVVVAVAVLIGGLLMAVFIGRGKRS